jgi:hypothetical protein
MALFFYENIILIQAELRFTADCQRDLFLVYGLSHEGVFPHTGIRVAALGLDLGPLYHLLLSPFIAFWPSPSTVHWFNLSVCVLGLWAYWRWASKELGTAAALLSILFYTQSTGHTALTDTVWHVGATPGVIFGLIAAAGSWLRSGRLRHLLLSGALLMTLVQLHSLGVVFGPAGLCVLWLGRQHLHKGHLVTLSIVMLLTALPLLLYTIPSIFDPLTGAAKHRGDFEFSPNEFLSSLGALIQPRYLLDPITARAAIFLLACAGMLSGLLKKIRGADSPVVWNQLSVVMMVQLVFGSIATASVISYELVGRYFLPLIIPIFVLTGIGVAHLNHWLRNNGRSTNGRALTFATAVLMMCIIGPAEVPVLSTIPNGGNTLQSDDSLDYLLLEEQEAVVAYFVNERGLSWNQMRGRIHGNFFGPFTGIRYIERITRTNRQGLPPTEELSSHWRIRIDGISSPPIGSIVETIRLPQRTRTLVLERYMPNIDPQTIEVAGRPCSWSLPYIWSQSTTEQLKLVGFPMGHGRDIHHCMGKENPAKIQFPITPECNLLNLEISIDGAIQADDIRVTIHADGLPDLLLPIQPVLSLSKSQFSVTTPEHDETRFISIEINRQRTLGFLDIY